MLRLLTLRKYLPVMTVQEQERIFRDGQPFTLAELERWERMLHQREQKINNIFNKAMKKIILTAFATVLLASCSNAPKLDITGRYYNNMLGLDSADYWEIREDGTWTRMTHTGIPFDGTWEDVKTSDEWKVPAREIRMKDKGDSIWRICFTPDSAQWLLTEYDNNGNRKDGWFAIKK